MGIFRKKKFNWHHLEETQTMTVKNKNLLEKSNLRYMWSTRLNWLRRTWRQVMKKNLSLQKGHPRQGNIICCKIYYWLPQKNVEIIRCTQARKEATEHFLTQKLWQRCKKQGKPGQSSINLLSYFFVLTVPISPAIKTHVCLPKNPTAFPRKFKIAPIVFSIQ